MMVGLDILSLVFFVGVQRSKFDTLITYCFISLKITWTITH